ncbi:MAG: chromosome segregation protein SMC [Pirellulales bacterium]
MLKALELSGFKSFADRSRLEFPIGITVIVGPNGSGKSNIVDAIKWVLGTQSAKALRGKEMSDVIFSGTQGRKHANSAEVSLIFDNSNGLLDFDAPEVQVTRRVYRSGESEYLINRQPCRLRDIRDLFAGTGVAGGAYSIIEQGKVDALLQSSPHQRRLIFEEAAGISRFKQKRDESGRRLDRVEQNLLRLSDIVDELESRLRSVRSQAGRAKKYKERSDRLWALRTQVGLADWQELSAKIGHLQKQILLVQNGCQVPEQRLLEEENLLTQAELESDQLQQQMTAHRDQCGTARERIAQCDSTRSSQLARSDELSQEAQRLELQLLTMTSRVGDSQQLVSETLKELKKTESQFSNQHQDLQHGQTQLQQTQDNLDVIREQIDHWRSQHTDAVRNAALLDNQIESLNSQQQTAIASSERCGKQIEIFEANRIEYVQQLDNVQAEHGRLIPATEKSNRHLEAAQQKLRQARTQLAGSQKQLAELQGQLTGARERAIVLEELERRLDGLSAGVKEVLKLKNENPQGPFQEVLGVVADLLHVDIDTAPLIEIALGERANHLVVQHSSPLLDQLLSNHNQLPGRVGFLRLDVPSLSNVVDRVNLSTEPGVMGRADQFVETLPELAKLTRRLLGRFWFVDTLANAMQLANGFGRGLNFVTVAGEVVHTDGTLIVGTRQATTGILSRRSELRSLQCEINEIESQHSSLLVKCRGLDSTIVKGEQLTQQMAAEHAQLTEQLGEARLQLSSSQVRLEQCLNQLNELAIQRDTAANASVEALDHLQKTHQELEHCQRELAHLETSLLTGAQQTAQFERQIANCQRDEADQRVALARSEQRRDGLQRQIDQLRRDHDERDRALIETRNRVEECHQQRHVLLNSVLDLTTELAELYRTVETFTSLADSKQSELRSLRSNRKVRLQNVEKIREHLLQQQKQLSKLQLQTQQNEQLRESLAERMQEDYQIDLATIAASELTDTLPDRDVTDQEINRLRHQLQNIGPVNLESLTELEALEERYEGLSQQHQDLCVAKSQLKELITQINTDSRQLFISTIEVIRNHFQELFRNLFGGGEADIVMDSDNDKNGNIDVLECGIEIIARPPGKQPRSISLLSGGERTLTCVALLLAIFQSRPSPFCILDEVDAALDEANIDRFTEVIKQFMKSTQFVVVTHSKRTMACADTLYGITMQESGISKRVSVRFEDVGANGQIRKAA